MSDHHQPTAGGSATASTSGCSGVQIPDTSSGDLSRRSLGNIFKLKLFIFLMKRALENDYEFGIDINLNRNKKIDDLLFLCKHRDQNKVLILQAKHKNESNTAINHTALTSETVDKGKFYLLEHFETFIKSKMSNSLKEYASKQLVIVTNGSFEIDSNARNETFAWSKYCTFKSLSGSDFEELLNIDRQTKCCKFTEHFRKSEFIDLVPERQRSLSGELTKEFFENFCIITNCPTENELDKLIGDEIVNKMNSFHNEMLCHFLEKEMITFFTSCVIKNKQMKKVLYSSDDGWQFYKELEKKIDVLAGCCLSIPYVEMLRSYRVAFVETDIFQRQRETYLKFFLLPKSDVLYITSECAVLSAIKVLQTFNLLRECKSRQKINGCLFMDLDTIESQYDLVKSAFLLYQNNYVLVIVGEKEITPNVVELCNGLLPVSEETRAVAWKKVIMISQDQRINGTKPITDINLNFKDLVSKSQKEILRKQVVFQGKCVPLNKLMSQSLAEEIIDAKILLKLMRGETFLIGRKNTFSNFGYVNDFYIERELFVPSNQNVLTENDLLLLNQKTVLIVDDSGQGKSTLLSSLSEKLQSKSLAWIIRVNLNEYPLKCAEADLCKVVFNATNTMEFLLKLGVSYDPTFLEESIFKRSGIALFVDGFDEIGAIYQDKIMELLKTINTFPHIRLWITTNFQQCQKLEIALETIAIHLNPLSKDRKIEFLSKFLKWNYSHCISGDEILDKGADKKMEYLLQLEKAMQPPKGGDTEQSDSNERDFVLSLLHLRMLAEVIVAKSYELPPNFSEFDLYSAFVDTKFEILNTKSDFVAITDCLHFEEDALRVVLSEKAMDIFFSTENFKRCTDLSKMFTMNGNHKNISVESLLDQVGLLNKDQSAFIHHGFAEYFASKYLFDNLKIEHVGNAILHQIQEQKNKRIYDFLIEHIKQNYAVIVEDVPLNRVLLAEMFVVPKSRTDIHQFRCLYRAYEWYIDTHYFSHNDKADVKCWQMTNLLEYISVKRFFPTELTDLLPHPAVFKDDADAIFDNLVLCGLLKSHVLGFGFADSAFGAYFLSRYLCKCFKNTNVQSLIISRILRDDKFLLARRLFLECLLLFPSQFRGIIEWIIISDKQYTNDLIIPESTRELIDFIENHEHENRYMPNLFKEFQKIYKHIDDKVAATLFNHANDSESFVSLQLNVFEFEHLYQVKKRFNELFDHWKARSFTNYSEFVVMSIVLSRNVARAFDETASASLCDLHYVCVPPPMSFLESTYL